MITYEQYRTARDTARARANSAKETLDAQVNTAKQNNQAIASASASVEAARTQVDIAKQEVADALKELGPTPGLQVHRSHWVTDAHVETLKRDGGRLVLIMKDGTEIPVSRTYAEAVRSRFGDITS